MVKIKLTQGKFALVDDEFEYLNQFTWQFAGAGYAYRTERIGLRKLNKKKGIYMHKEIMGKEGEVDHINRNKLDNRKSNLRIVTRLENSLNKGLQLNNTSGHKGIVWDKRRNKWIAQIKSNTKNHFLGYFGDIKDAIKARKQAELFYWPNLNI